MADAIKFSLNANNLGYASDEELQAEVTKTGSKFFDDPGNFNLTIAAANYHPSKDTGSIYCKGDGTWANIKLSLKDDKERELNHWLQVPTQEIVFGPKKTLFVFKKFQEFLLGIGVQVSMTSLQGVMEKWFTDPAKLVGQELNADLGYEGDHVAKATDSDEYEIIVSGKPMAEDGKPVRLPDRSSAIQYSKSMGIDPGYIRVLKFTARKVLKTRSAAASTEW